MRDVVVGRDEENEAGIVTDSRIPDLWLNMQSVSVAARFRVTTRGSRGHRQAYDISIFKFIIPLIIFPIKPLFLSQIWIDGEIKDSLLYSTSEA